MAGKKAKGTTSKNVKVNSSWLSNAAKSMGMSINNVMKTEISPNLHEVSSSAMSASKKLLGTLRTTKSTGGKVEDILSSNKFVRAADTAFKNALEDIKTGNFNNAERLDKVQSEAFGMGDEDYGFDDFDDSGWSFDDEDVSGGTNQNINIVNSGDGGASIAIAQEINKQTKSQINSAKANTDVMVAMTGASMTHMQKLGDEVIGHLSNISSSLESVVEFNNNNFNKFIESSLAFYERAGANSENDGYGNDYQDTRLSGADVLRGGKGGLDIGRYKEYVKQQLKDNMEGSGAGMLASMLNDDVLNMFAANPLGMASEIMVKATMPKILTNTMKGVDEAFGVFMPAFLTKIGDLALSDGDGSLLSKAKAFLGRTLGLRVEDKDSIDRSASIEKGPVPFDGMTKHAITEVITKELREQTSYLKAIAGKQGIDTEEARRGSSVWDWDTSTYKTLGSVNDDLLSSIRDSITSSMRDSFFANSLLGKQDGSSEGAVSKLNDSDKESFEEFVNKFMLMASNHDGNIDLSDRGDSSVFKSIMDNLDGDKNIKKAFTASIADMLQNNPVAAASLATAKLQGKQAKVKTLKDIESDPYYYNLYSSDIGDDIFEQLVPELKRKRLEEEEAAQRQSNRDNRQDTYGNYSTSLQNRFRTTSSINRQMSGSTGNSSFAGDGVFENIGNRAKGAMMNLVHGNGSAAGADLAGMFTDTFDRVFTSLNDNFFKPLKASLFGEKDEDGFLRDGIFAATQNKMIDMKNSFMHTLTGRAYKRSDGEEVEESEESVVSYMKSIGTSIKLGITEKLFGKKNVDENGNPTGEKTGGWFSKIKTGFTDSIVNWHDAIFGKKTPEEEKKDIMKNFGESIKEVLPASVGGAAIGLAGGSLSGGILGSMIGGPLGGAVLGMAGGMLSKNEKFMSFLFGEKDDDGNRLDTGFISKKVQNFFGENKGAIIGGASLGMLKAGLLGSKSGFLGTLVGGPLAGAVLGVGTSLLVKSNTFQKFLFGDEESGQGGIVTYFKKAFGGSGKSSPDAESEGGKLLGMGMLGSGVGAMSGALLAKVGIFGAMAGPWGPIGGALAGLALTMKSQSKRFSRWLFGEKDEEGNKIAGKTGVIGQFGHMLNANVLEPIKTGVANFTDGLAYFLKYDILGNLRFAVRGLLKPVSAIFEGVREKSAKFLDDATSVVKEKIVSPFVNIIRDNVINPIVATTGTILKVTTEATKFVAALPFKILGGINRTFKIFDAAVAVVKAPFKVLGKAALTAGGVLLKGVTGTISVLGKVTDSLIVKPVSAIISTVTGIGDYVRNKFDEITYAVKETFHEHIVKPIGGFIKDKFVTPLKEGVTTVVTFFKDGLKEVITAPFKVVKLLNERFKLVDKALSLIKAPFKLLGKAAMGLAKGMGTVAKTILGTILKPFKAIGKFLGLGNGLLGKIAGTFSQARQDFKDNKPRYRHETGDDKEEDRNFREERRAAKKSLRETISERKNKRKNIKNISKYTNNQYSSDTEEARQAAIDAGFKGKFKGDATLTAQEIKDKTKGTVGASESEMSKLDPSKAGSEEARQSCYLFNILKSVQELASGKKKKNKDGTDNNTTDTHNNPIDDNPDEPVVVIGGREGQQAVFNPNGRQPLETSETPITDAFSEIMNNFMGGRERTRNNIEESGGLFKYFKNKMFGDSDDGLTDEERGASSVKGFFNKQLENIRKGLGYADGTDNAEQGLKWVGEQGPEVMWMKGGESVFSNGSIIPVQLVDVNGKAQTFLSSLKGTDSKDSSTMDSNESTLASMFPGMESNGEWNSDGSTLSKLSSKMKLKDANEKALDEATTADERRAEIDAEEEKTKAVTLATMTAENTGEQVEEQKSFTEGWSSIFSKKGLITGGLILLFPLIKKLINNFPGLMKGLFDGIGKVLSAIGPVLTGIMNVLKTTLGEIGDSIASMLRFLDKQQGEDGKNPGEIIEDEVDQLLDTVKNLGDGNLVEAVKSYIYNEDGEITATTGEKVHLLLNAANSGVDGIVEAVGKNARKQAGLKDGLGSKIKRLISKKERKKWNTANRDVGWQILNNPENTDEVMEGLEEKIAKGKSGKRSIFDRMKEFFSKDKNKGGTEAVADGATEVVDDATESTTKAVVKESADDAAEATTKTVVKEGAEEVTEQGAKKKGFFEKIGDWFSGNKDKSKTKTGKTTATTEVAKNTDNVVATPGSYLGGPSSATTEVTEVASDYRKYIPEGFDEPPTKDGWLKKLIGFVDDVFKKLAEVAEKKMDKIASKSTILTKLNDARKKIKDMVNDQLDTFISKMKECVKMNAGKALKALKGALFFFSIADNVTRTCQLFEVPPKSANAKMKLISTIIYALADLHFAVAVLFIADEIMYSANGFSFVRLIANILYGLLTNEDDASKLDAAQADWRAEYEKYQDTNLEYQMNQKIDAGEIPADTTLEEFRDMVEKKEVEIKQVGWARFNTLMNPSLMDKALMTQNDKRDLKEIETALGYNRETTASSDEKKPDSIKNAPSSAAAGGANDTSTTASSYAPMQDIAGEKMKTKDIYFDPKTGRTMKKLKTGEFVYVNSQTLKETGDAAFVMGEDSTSRLQTYEDAKDKIMSKEIQEAEKTLEAEEKESKIKGLDIWLAHDGSYYKRSGKGYTLYTASGDILQRNVDVTVVRSKAKTGLLQQAKKEPLNSAERRRKQIEENQKKISNVYDENGKIKYTTNTGKTAAPGSTYAGSPQLPTTTKPTTPGMSYLGGSGEGVRGGGRGESDSPDTLNNFPYFSQADERWSDTSYAISGEEDATINTSGCGPTAMSMIASKLKGQNFNPETMSSLAYALGDRDETGTNWNYIDDASKVLGIESSSTYEPSAAYIQRELSQGKPMILSGSGSSDTPYTGAGHYVVATGVDSNGNIMVSDPRGKKFSKKWKPTDLSKTTKAAWSFGGRGFGRKGKKGGGRGETKVKSTDVIAVAKNEVGYLEKASNSQLEDKVANAGDKNFTKYGEFTGTNGLYWCAAFVCWCLNQACNQDGEKLKQLLYGPKSALCEALRAQYASAGKLDKTPIPGDLIFFETSTAGRANHIGIVEKVENGTVYTIEGNTSAGKDVVANGGGVACKSYPVDKSKIIGYGHPPYDDTSTFAGTTGATSADGATTSTGSSSGNIFSNIGSLFSEAGSRLINSLFGGQELNTDFKSFVSSMNQPETTDAGLNGTTTAGGVGTIAGNDTPEKVWNFLRSIGYSEATTAGILGNMYQESTVDNTKIQGNGKGPAAGIVQWENFNKKSSRWKTMADYAQSKGKDWTDLQSQLEFLDMEISGKDKEVGGDGYTASLFNKKGGYDAFRSMSDPRAACLKFEETFERAGTPMMETRYKKTSEYYDKYKGKPIVQGGNTSTGTGNNQSAPTGKDVFTNNVMTNMATGGGSGEGVKTGCKKLDDVYGGRGSSTTQSSTKSSYSSSNIVDAVTSQSTNKNVLNLISSTPKSNDTNDILAKAVEILGVIAENTGVSSDTLESLKHIASTSKRSSSNNQNIIVAGNKGGGSVPQGTQNPTQSKNSILANAIARGTA